MPRQVHRPSIRLFVYFRKGEKMNNYAQNIDRLMQIQLTIIVFVYIQITHNKYMLEQLITNTSKLGCHLCKENIQNFNTLISSSLYGKYSSSQNFYYTKQINEILEEAISPAYIDFQDNNFYDNDQEFMKRSYKQQQFPKKIEMLSQYYKFHRDLPVWNARSVQSIMERYYNKIKDVDYKKIKSVLKKEQGISLTTHKSFTSYEDDSQYTKRSRYSTMLNQLETSNDSVFLREFCDKIGKAFKKLKCENSFKGCYYSGEKKFEQFLKKQKKRRDQKVDHEANKKSVGMKKMKFNPKLVTKDDQALGIKQINFASHHSIKDRKYISKNTISIEKTTANETISRQEKIKREKSKSNFQTVSSRQSLTRKNSTLRNLIIEDLIHPSIKALKGDQILFKINNQNMKTINEIYRPFERNERKEKPPAELVRKSSKQLTSRLKVRSNSHHNLPTANLLNKDCSKNKLLSSLKQNKSPENKYTSATGHRSSKQIEVGEGGTLTGRQNSQRTLRSNSSCKIGNNLDKQYKSSKISNQKIGNKRKSGIEQILEKKLNGFKRKQAVF